ncbi:hypothetical protein HU200_015025 [Digitaria exilis]|uniref:Late embryogenesis abundant protein LEA-2 subgroup domain-containing protein n=1 Tax=Digitaria exilis TaxID=1010633 RepID=A0A835F9Z9_9POAL|nr:hypothetical protein HU200_015025 [Digitaria exilis]
MAAAVVAGGEAGDSEKQPPFRWLNVARCAVAAVVMVLILAVIINAVQVVLRPNSLSLTVVEGTVFVKRLPEEKNLSLSLDLRAENPSGRARMYYTNLDAYLLNTTVESTAKPRRDCIIYFRPKDIVAFDQQQAVMSSMKLHVTNKSMPGYFDTLYANGIMRDVTLRLDGDLVTQVTINETRRATYYYMSLIVGGDRDDEAFRNWHDHRI